MDSYQYSVAEYHIAVVVVVVVVRLRTSSSHLYYDVKPTRERSMTINKNIPFRDNYKLIYLYCYDYDRHSLLKNNTFVPIMTDPKGPIQ